MKAQQHRKSTGNGRVLARVTQTASVEDKTCKNGKIRAASAVRLQLQEQGSPWHKAASVAQLLARKASNVRLLIHKRKWRVGAHAQPVQRSTLPLKHREPITQF